MECSLALLEVDRCEICPVSSLYLYAGCGGSQGPWVCRCTSTSSCSVTNFDDALEYFSMSQFCNCGGRHGEQCKALCTFQCSMTLECLSTNHKALA